jgi:hypothetical protein
MARDEFQPQAEPPAEVELPVRAEPRGLDPRTRGADAAVERQDEPEVEAGEIEELEQGSEVERQTDSGADVERE